MEKFTAVRGDDPYDPDHPFYVAGSDYVDFTKPEAQVICEILNQAGDVLNWDTIEADPRWLKTQLPPMTTEFVTNRQWDSQASRIFNANIKRDGESLARAAIARRASRHIVEIRDDQKGMIVTPGWREAMKESPDGTH